MGWSRANHWCTAGARQLAADIAGINGLFCGPTVVAWVAAVWNLLVKKRAYDFATRLKDKSLFPDGPRNFDGPTPRGSYFGLKWQSSLHSILKRETHNELGLSGSTIKQYGTLHDELEKHDMPIVIRMYPDTISLHYVTLYKSQKREKPRAFDRIQFYWQDNGLYGGENEGNEGLYKTAWRDVGKSQFMFGARRVVKL
jgi:hypothetical protein